MFSMLQSVLPHIRRLRAQLTLLLLLLCGGGWFLTWPTAPIATWDEDGEIWYLAMRGLHTLIVCKPTSASFYPESSAMRSQTITYQGAFDDHIIALSADGKWMVAATLIGPRTASQRLDGIIEVWSLEPVQAVAAYPVPLIRLNQVFDSIAISHDGTLVGWVTEVDRSSRYEVSIWDRSTQVGALTQYHADRSTDGLLERLTFVGTAPLGIYSTPPKSEVRQIRDGLVRYHISTSESPGTISPDEMLISYQEPGQVSVRRLDDGQLLWRVPIRRSAPLSLDTTLWVPHTVFSSDSRFLVTAASVNRESGGLAIGVPSFSRLTNEPALLWDMRTGQVVQRFAVQPDGATKLAYSPDGQYVAAARDSEVRVFRVQPQLPYLQPLCVLLGLILGLLLFWQWLWARRLPKDGA